MLRRCRDLVLPIARRLPLRLLSSVAGGLLTATGATLGCANDSLPATAQPPTQVPTPPSPKPSFTISGVVYEHTASGRRPAGGVVLNVLSEISDVATSDMAGRYSASVRGGWVSIAAAEPTAYMSPCPSGSGWLSVNRTIDVDVVAKTVLSTTGVPDSYPRSAIYVPGTVVEQTATGPRPVAGALVTLGAEYPVYSTTLSDSIGRYVLCTAPPGSGTDQQTTLNVAKDGYAAASSLVLLGWGYSVNVELLRNP